MRKFGLQKETNRSEVALLRAVGHNTQTENSSVSLEARLVFGPYRAEQATRFTGGHDFAFFAENFEFPMPMRPTILEIRFFIISPYLCRGGYHPPVRRVLYSHSKGVLSEHIAHHR